MKKGIAALVLCTTLAGAQISPQFFGLHVLSLSSPWPPTVGVQFSSWRSQDSGVRWSDINVAQGQYDWTMLDQWLALTAEYGQYVLYDFYYTPGWASQCPTCTCAPYSAPGGCYPPTDLNPDGSGTDQDLKNFMTALMQHVGVGKIKYIEIWNEPNIPNEYAGTMAQLVRMASDVRAIAKSFDPNVQIVGPAETGDGPNDLQMQYLAAFLAAGGGEYVDIMALHGYVINPEDIITRINNHLSVMSQYDQGGKEVYVTEGSWWTATQPYPGSKRPGFTFRQYLSTLSTPVQRFYLYAFDNDEYGTLWNPHKEEITQSGTAYQLFYGWLVEATMTQACQGQPENSTIWSCLFSKPDGYEAEALWSTVLPTGQLMDVTVPSQFVQYRDLYGKVYPITKHRVRIGYDPIWLENQTDKNVER